MGFTRHAKNKLRLYKLEQGDIVETIELGERTHVGDKIDSR
jgi:hypothetical protein